MWPQLKSWNGLYWSAIGGTLALVAVAEILTYRRVRREAFAEALLRDSENGFPTLTTWRPELRDLPWFRIVSSPPNAKWYFNCIHNKKWTTAVVEVDKTAETVITEYRQRFYYPAAYTRKRTLMHTPEYFEPVTRNWDRHWVPCVTYECHIWFPGGYWVEAGESTTVRPEPEPYSETRPVRRCVNGECVDLFYELRPPRARQEYADLAVDCVKLPNAPLEDSLVLAPCEKANAMEPANIH
jgi:hypothetical protein